MAGRCRRRAHLDPHNSVTSDTQTSQQQLQVGFRRKAQMQKLSKSVCLSSPAIEFIPLNISELGSNWNWAPHLLGGDQTSGDHRRPKGFIFCTFTGDAVEDHTWVLWMCCGCCAFRWHSDHSNKLQLIAADCSCVNFHGGVVSPGCRFGISVLADFGLTVGGIQHHRCHCKSSNDSTALLQQKLLAIASVTASKRNWKILSYQSWTIVPEGVPCTQPRVQSRDENPALKGNPWQREFDTSSVFQWPAS